MLAFYFPYTVFTSLVSVYAFDLGIVIKINFVCVCFAAIREDGMPGGRNKSIGPVQVRFKRTHYIMHNVYVQNNSYSL